MNTPSKIALLISFVLVAGHEAFATQVIFALGSCSSSPAGQPGAINQEFDQTGVTSLSATADCGSGIAATATATGSISGNNYGVNLTALATSPCATVACPATSGVYTNVQETFATGGPVRNGLVEVNFTGTGSSATSQAPAEWELFFTADSGFCRYPGPCSPPATGLIPVQLGTTLAFGLTEIVGGDSPVISYGDIDATASVSLNLIFFEADGATPVALLDVQEPGSYSLVGIGLAVAFIIMLRKPS